MPKKPAILIRLGASAFDDPSLVDSENFKISSDAFATYFKESLDFSYRVLDLFDKKDNPREILDKISAHLTKYQEAECCVVHYCGHGISPETNRYYLGLKTTDSKIAGLTALDPTNIFTRIGDTIRNKPVFAIIDACFAGMTAKGAMSSKVSKQTVDKKIKSLRVGSNGLCTISAAPSDEIANFLGEDGKTKFTTAFFAAMQSEMFLASEHLTADEIIEEARGLIQSGEILDPETTPLPEVQDPKQLSRKRLSKAEFFHNPHFDPKARQKHLPAGVRKILTNMDSKPEQVAVQLLKLETLVKNDFEYQEDVDRVLNALSNDHQHRRAQQLASHTIQVLSGETSGGASSSEIQQLIEANTRKEVALEEREKAFDSELWRLESELKSKHRSAIQTLKVEHQSALEAAEKLVEKANEDARSSNIELVGKLADTKRAFQIALFIIGGLCLGAIMLFANGNITF